MKSESDTVVFLGPTLPVDAATAILPARYEPPARLGSVYELVGGEVHTIVLIDGLFHNQPSVWQREIDAALGAGMTVFGAASMGALRAAELAPFGMIGHGKVFEWYRDGLIDGDDEVAVLHTDASRGYQSISEPLVNIRYTLECAVAQEVLRPEQRDAVLTHAKTLYYPERSYARLLRSLREDRELTELAAPLENYVRSSAVNLKRRDALALLSRVAGLRRLGQTTPNSRTTEPYRVRTRHGHARLNDTWRRRGQEYRSLEHEGVDWTLGEIWNLLERGEGEVSMPNLGGEGSLPLSAAQRRELLFDRAVRDLAVEHIRVRNDRVPEQATRTVTGRMKEALSQETAAASLLDWCRACRITQPEFNERLSKEATIAWLATDLPEDIKAATEGWVDPISAGPPPGREPGLYLRVFVTHAERLAARRVALCALLDECDQDADPVPQRAWPALLAELEVGA